MVYTPEKQIEKRFSDQEEELVKCLLSLKPEASEDEVNSDFIIKIFLDKLGFSAEDKSGQFSTDSNNQEKVDYALRRSTEDDSFKITETNPHVLLEIKGRHWNLEFKSPDYKKAVEQLKRYLLGNKCKSAQWGIITNSKHIQLFRKHGKVIFPSTPCLEITVENIVDITSQIRKKIENTSRALTVSVYNNKGMNSK